MHQNSNCSFDLFSNCVFSFWSKKLLHPVAARLALGLGGERGGLLGREERQSPAVVHCPVVSSNEKKNLLSFFVKGNAMSLEIVDFVECLLNLAACLRERLEDLIDPDSLSVSGVPTGVRKGEPGCKRTLDWAREGALRRPPGLLGAPEIFLQKQILGTICRLPEHHVCIKGGGCE